MSNSTMIGRRLTALLRGPSQFIRITGGHSSSRLIIYSARRCYATPGRPRSTVGEPSRPIKRTAKRTTTQKKSKKSTSTTKKPAAKAKPKRKAAAKKAAKKVKKPLTEDQIASKKARAETKLIKELTIAALKPPAVKHYNAYIVFVANKWSGFRYTSDVTSVRQAEFASHIREASSAYKALPAADLEHYNHIANTKVRESQAAFKAWVESHSPEKIAAANSARSKLRRREKKAKGTSTRLWPAIKDERTAKRVASPYIRFVQNRYASGDFKHIGVSEASKLLAGEWKALPDSDKQKYQQIFAQEQSQYANNSKSTQAHEVGYLNTSSQPEAVAATA